MRILRRIYNLAKRVLCGRALVNTTIVASQTTSAVLVRLAALQPSCELGAFGLEAQRAEAVANSLALLELAAAQQADLALLPERFTLRSVAVNQSRLPALAQIQGDALFQQLSAAAQRYRMAIIAPVDEVLGNKLVNSAWVFDHTGRFVGRYCKVHCTATERAWGVAPGSIWPVFDLGFAKVGVMICHDMAFPESARCLMLNGAEVICWPHNQSGWGELAWDAILRTRAFDNDVYIVAASCGVPLNRTWRPGMAMGLSGVVAPDGTWLVSAGRGVGVSSTAVSLRPSRMIHDFSAGGVENYRAVVLRERRVDTYQILTEPDLWLN